MNAVCVVWMKIDHRQCCGALENCAANLIAVSTGCLIPRNKQPLGFSYIKLFLFLWSPEWAPCPAVQIALHLAWLQDMVIGLQGAMPGEVQSILLALLGFYL